MPKGPIVQHHFLILPKQHFASAVQCPAPVLRELELNIANIVYVVVESPLR